MIKFRCTILAMLILSLTLSCAQSQSPTIIQGRINDFGAGDVSVQLKYFDLIEMEEKITYQSDKINADGSFKMILNPLPGHVWDAWITIGREVKGISLMPGDSLYIEVNSANFDETITFSGKGSERNNYRAWRYLDYYDSEEGVSFNYLKKLPFDEFVKANEKIRNDQLVHLEKSYENGRKDLFYENEKVNIEIDVIRRLITDTNTNRTKEYEATKALVSKIDIQAQDALFQYSYRRNALLEYVRFMAGGKPSDWEVYQTGKRLLSGNTLRFFYKEEVITLINGEDKERIIADVKTNIKDIQDADKIIEAYNYGIKIAEAYPNKPANIVAFAPTLEKDTFYITGHINKYDGSVKEINLYDQGIASKSSLSAEVDSEGNFSFSVPVFYSHDLMLRIGRNGVSVMANPGDHLHIENDGENFNYFGDGAAYNSELNTLAKKIGSENHPFRSKDFISKNPEEIKAELIARYADAFNQIDTYMIGKDYPLLKEWATYNALQDNYGSLLAYNRYQNYLSTKNGTEPKPLPKKFYDFISKVEDFQPSALINSSVVFLMLERKTVYQMSEDNVADNMNPALLPPSKENFNQFEYETLFAFTMSQEIAQKNFENMEGLMSDFKQNVKTKWIVDEITTQYATEKEIFDGLIIPEGSDLNQSPKTSGDSLLSSIIAKHKGKVIYIDIWATWCGPCIGEFAFAEAFHEGIDHEKVAMVYLAGESKENAWKAAISKHGLKGDHYLLTKDQYDQIAAKLESRGFPHYAIIDQAGIIKYKSAPRPSIQQGKLNTQLIETLNTL